MLIFSSYYPIYVHNFKFLPVLYIYYSNYASEHLSSQFKELGQNWLMKFSHYPYEVPVKYEICSFPIFIKEIIKTSKGYRTKLGLRYNHIYILLLIFCLSKQIVVFHVKLKQ